MYLTLRDRPGGPVTRSTRGRRVGSTVIVLGLVSMFTDISSESVNAVFPLYVTSVLGLSVLSYGFLDGLYQGVSALVRILGGWLADRGDHPKWVAVVGYGVSAVSRVGLLFAVGLGSLTAATTADRLGKGLRTAPRDVMIASSVEPEVLGRAFGVHRMLDTAGALLGPLAAFFVLLAVPRDFHSVFVLSLAAAVVGLALLLLLVPDLRPRRRAAAVAPVVAPPAPPRGPRRPRTPTDPAVRRIWWVAGLLGLCTIGDGFLYLAVTRDDAVSASWFPLLFVGTNIAFMVLAIPLGRLGDRIGRGPVFLAGHVALLAAYLCAAGFFVGAGATIGLIALLGTYYAATDGMLPAIVSALVEPGHRARAIATAQTFVAGARFVSSLLFGLAWVRLGPHPAVELFGAALAIAAIVAFSVLRRDVLTGGTAPVADGTS